MSRPRPPSPRRRTGRARSPEARAAAGERRPTPAELAAARGKRVPDVIDRDLAVLFVGINPGLYSGAVGHHFARPGNRFWAVLYRAGFTPRLLAPGEERALLRYRCGVTNLVNRSTATAAELSARQLRAGGRRLRAKVRRYRPRLVAILGVGAYQAAFGYGAVAVGAQPQALDGALLWVLPNPSGLNASYQLGDLVRLFRRLRNTVRRLR